jgi:hypothetical protein
MTMAQTQTSLTQNVTPIALDVHLVVMHIASDRP